MIQHRNAISVCRGPVTYVSWWSIDDAHTLITVETLGCGVAASIGMVKSRVPVEGGKVCGGV